MILRFMMDRMNGCPGTNSFDQQSGGLALVAALVLLAVVSILGATVLQTTSTEIATSGHFKSAVQSLYDAEAGIEEARIRLGGTVLANPHFIGDPASGSDPHWSAYILTTSNWIPTLDPDFSAHDTNFIPTTSQSNTTIHANSVQNVLPYWVKIRHKTEYDAERLGHRPDHPHYEDKDGSIHRHRRAHPGNVLVFGYPTVYADFPIQFSTRDPVPYQPVHLVRAFGGNTGLATRVEVEVVHAPGPKRLAALYAQARVVVHGDSSAVSGHDSCHRAPSLPPVYAPEVVPSGNPVFDGSPNNPQQGSVFVDIVHNIHALQEQAIPLTEDQHNVQLGSSRQYRIFEAGMIGQGKPRSLTIHNTKGYGILLSERNVVLKGHVQWNGVVMTSGTLTLDGQGQSIDIRGAIWAREILDVSGHLHVQYDSCSIQSALSSFPLKVVRWKEVF